MKVDKSNKSNKTSNSAKTSRTFKALCFIFLFFALVLSMANVIFADATNFNSIKYDTDSVKVGATTTVNVWMYDSSGYVSFASGTTVPVDAEAGYAKGCIFIDTNASAGSIFFVNEGSYTSCAFNGIATPTNYVALTGAQTVAGVKTLTSNLMLPTPTPTAVNAAVDRGYVDGNTVLLTTAQTVDGIKTFSSPIAGSITGNSATVTGGVYTTTDQTVAGAKKAIDPFNYSLLTTADNIAYVSTFPISSLQSGEVINLQMPAANSGASCTLNVNGKGAKKMLQANQVTQITTGDLIASGSYFAQYNALLDSATGAWVVTALPPTSSIAVGTDLSGTVSTATVAKINGVALGTTTATSGNVLYANGTSWGTSTPDLAGLVDKISAQTIAGIKNIIDPLNYSLLATADNIAYTSTFPAVTLQNGQVIAFKMPAANSGASCTLNVNGKGAKKMLRASDMTTQITTNDLIANGSYIAQYNTTLDSAAGAWVVVDSPSTSAITVGGDLSGTTGTATVAKINGVALGTTTATNGNVLLANGTNWSTSTVDGAGIIAKTGAQTGAGVKTWSDMAIFSSYITNTRTESSQMEYYDDFMEGANVLASTLYAKGYWTGGGTSGTQAIIAGVNGILELDTGATGSQTSTLVFTNANFDNDNAWIFESKVKTDLLTNRKVNVGMYVDTNDYIIFDFNTTTDAANIYLLTDSNNAGEVSSDTTIDLVANTYITFRIESFADDTFKVYINGTEVLASHGTHLMRDVAFKPYFYIDNKAEAQSNKLDIDYVKIWQNR